VAPLEDDAERVALVRGDVRALSDRTFDVITAMNSSWALFDDDALVEYACNAGRCLEEGGVLVLELFGGSEMRRVLTREHRHEGFTYVWEQRAFDPTQAVRDARIHIGLESGRALRDAFAYRFHLRSLDALEELLRTAGLVRSELLVEGRDGRYRRRASEPRAPLWRGLLVCVRA
jgi:SAM-dependent methyltransferase